MTTYEHWKITIDEDNNFWLGFDRANAKVNTLNQDVLIELDHILNTVRDSDYQALIIASEKKSGFIVRPASTIDESKERRITADITHSLIMLGYSLELSGNRSFISKFKLPKRTKTELACIRKIFIIESEAGKKIAVRT